MGSNFSNTTDPATSSDLDSALARGKWNYLKEMLDLIFNLNLADSAASSFKNAWVINAHLADNSVTTSKIADSNVTTAKIADSNVTNTKIADGSVTSTKIADGNVTQSKIAGGSVGINELKKAQGNASGTPGLSFNINQYAFASVQVAITTSDGVATSLQFGYDDASAGTLRMAHSTSGFGATSTRTYTWDYLTASENSRIYIASDPVTGNLISAWEAEDPVDEDESIPIKNGIDITDEVLRLIPICKPWMLARTTKPAWMANTKRFRDVDQSRACESLLRARLEPKCLAKPDEPLPDIEDLIADASLSHERKRWRAHMWLRAVAEWVTDNKQALSALIMDRFRYEHGKLILK